MEYPFQLELSLQCDIMLLCHIPQAKKTPLHLAAQMGQKQVCSTLLQMKADPTATDEVLWQYRLLSSSSTLSS